MELSLDQCIEQAQSAMDEWLKDAFKRFPQLREIKAKPIIEPEDNFDGRSYHLKLNGETLTTFRVVFHCDQLNELNDFYNSFCGK